MLGIDIVDLHDPNFSRRDGRALRLIQNENDILIEHSMIYWLLWTAKEAVFKCRRETLNFTPTSIPIKMEEDSTFVSGELKGKFEITDESILALVSDEFPNINYERLSIKNANGDVLRSEIVKYFASKNIEIKMGSDDLNLPVLLPGRIPISISHHGRWGAFAYPKSVSNV